jgi:hypothetical protein
VDVPSRPSTAGKRRSPPRRGPGRPTARNGLFDNTSEDVPGPIDSMLRYLRSDPNVAPRGARTDDRLGLGKCAAVLDSVFDPAIHDPVFGARYRYERARGHRNARRGIRAHARRRRGCTPTPSTSRPVIEKLAGGPRSGTSTQSAPRPCPPPRVPLGTHCPNDTRADTSGPTVQPTTRSAPRPHPRCHCDQPGRAGHGGPALTDMTRSAARLAAGAGLSAELIKLADVLDRHKPTGARPTKPLPRTDRFTNPL